MLERAENESVTFERGVDGVPCTRVAFFSDTVFDERTGRHERLFVNQQYDYLFVISWNEKLGDYALNIGAEEALRIARSAGAGLVQRGRSAG